MKPLNYKERNDKFLNFSIAGTISLIVAVFCFYYTNDYLLTAVAGNREEQYSRFLLYQKYQRQYTRQLEGINKSLAEGSLQTDNLVLDFKTILRKNKDSSSLMSKIVQLAGKDADLIGQKNKAAQELSIVSRNLQDCRSSIANP